MCQRRSGGGEPLNCSRKARKRKHCVRCREFKKVIELRRSEKPPEPRAIIASPMPIVITSLNPGDTNAVRFVASRTDQPSELREASLLLLRLGNALERRLYVQEQEASSYCGDRANCLHPGGPIKAAIAKHDFDLKRHRDRSPRSQIPGGDQVPQLSLPG